MSDDDRVKRHECAHACAVALLGRSVRMLDTIGDPEHGGRVYHDVGADTRDEAIVRLKVTLAGLLEECRDVSEIPPWPCDPDDGDEVLRSDRTTVNTLIKAYAIDRREYGLIVAQTLDLMSSDRWMMLYGAVLDELDFTPRIDEDAVRAIVKRCDDYGREDGTMDHLLLKATAEPIGEAGEFEAIISTEVEDRERDIVDADGMVGAIAQWTSKRLPLCWNHSHEAADVVGHIDPRSVRAVDGEVIARGWVDRSIPRGRDTWRLVKSNTLGFSYGFRILDAVARPGGGRHIRALDVLEVSATPIPCNGATRVLAYKNVEDDVDDIRAWARDLTLANLLAAPTTAPPTPARKTAPPVRHEHPIRVVEFDC